MHIHGKMGGRGPGHGPRASGPALTCKAVSTQQSGKAFRLAEHLHSTERSHSMESAHLLISCSLREKSLKFTNSNSTGQVAVNDCAQGQTLRSAVMLVIRIALLSINIAVNYLIFPKC